MANNHLSNLPVSYATEPAPPNHTSNYMEREVDSALAVNVKWAEAQSFMVLQVGNG